MIDIDFKNLRRIPEGNRDAFEEFVCQLVERFSHLPPQSPYYVPDGSSFHRFEGAGGDGGVECIWQLPSGKKRGYQAKLFKKFASSEKQQMAKSIKAAISNHPELDQYIFFFPLNLTGPTGKANKSQNGSRTDSIGSETEKLSRWAKEWSKLALEVSRGIRIDWLGKTSISNLLLLLDQKEDLRRYWFPSIYTSGITDEIVEAIARPRLSLVLPQGNSNSRFTYSARRTQLYGRKEELGVLRFFIDAPSKFSWMCILGSGGKGKSRLALEFCLSLNEMWDSGFLYNIKGVDWDRWQPSNPTLLVVDYAAQSVTDLNKMAFSLATRTELAKSVRLLLLERDSRDDWKNGFLSYGTRRSIILAHRYSDDMVLSGLSDTDLWNLMQEAFLVEGRVSPEVSQEVIADVVRIDAQRRPLFALFAADALIAGRHIRSWDREALLTDVLERDVQAYWMPAKVTKADHNLLVLSTLCGGFAVKALGEHQDVIELPSTMEYDPTKLTAMTGESAFDAIPALAPDILGSFFVLTYLVPKHQVDVRVQTFRDVAWKLNSKGTSAFLARTLMDFPDHPCTVPLLDGINPIGKEEARNWALLTAYKAFWSAKRDDVSDPALMEALKKCAVDTEDEDVACAFAMAILTQATNELQKSSYQSPTYWADYAFNMAAALPRSGVMAQCVSMIFGLTMEMVAVVEGIEVVSSYLDRLYSMIFDNKLIDEPDEILGLLCVAAAAPIASNDKKWCRRILTYYEKNKHQVVNNFETCQQMAVLLMFMLVGAVQNNNAIMAERVIKILKDDLLVNFDPVVSSYFCMCVAHLIMKTPTEMTQARLSVLRSKATSLLKREEVLDALGVLLSSKEMAVAFKETIEGSILPQSH